MESQIVKIGVINYKNYSENVMLDQNFSGEELFKILDTDSDCLSFRIEVEPDNWYTFKGTSTVERHTEIIGTTFNAFDPNPYKHKTRVSYQLSNGGFCYTKSKALAAAESQAKKDIRFLNKLKVTID
jgi:hypothetical protein